MSPKPSSRAPSPASTSRGFDEELGRLEALAVALRDTNAPTPDQITYLRKALAHRNNFLVSKAARLAADYELLQLLPDILAAYNRFFLDAARTDPQCWAKEALAKALVKLGHRSKEEYLRGMRHHQMEPSFGPPIDTAGTLRATCAHALVDCPGISDSDLLTALLDPFTDTDKTVRMEAARAIANVGGISAALILRLRALLGSAPTESEPEVLGAVFSSLLSLEGAQAVPLVSQALEPGDDFSAEAAFALAELRTESALATLLARLRAGADPWFTGVLLSAVALTRLPAAIDFLIASIERDERSATEAIEALSRIAPNEELRLRMEQAVDQADSARLRKALRKYLPVILE
jgi:HEAT repeat protein